MSSIISFGSKHLYSYSETDGNGRVVSFRLLDGRGQLPSRSTQHSAGYDLFSGETVSVAPGSVKLVDTFVTATIPIDCYARVAPRSSLASKFIDVGAGVIDADYTGTVRVVIYNFSADIFSIDAGDRIAQVIIERIFRPSSGKVR